MKKILLLPALITFPAFFIFAQNKKNDWTKDKLRGKVKVFEVTHYKAVEKFGEVVPDKKTFTTENVFTSSGYLKAFSFEDFEDKEKTSNTYKYNDKDLLVEERSVEDGEVTIAKITYDTRGNETEVNTYDKKEKLLGKLKKKYDSSGVLVRSDFYNGDGTLIGTEEYDYCFMITSGYWKRKTDKLKKSEEHWIYEFGNIDQQPLREKYFEGEAEKKSYNLGIDSSTFIMVQIFPKNDKKTIVTTRDFMYNDQGLVIMETRVRRRDNDELNKTVRIYEYDHNGNLVLEKDSERYYTTYAYTYDATGNWTRKVETHHSYGEIYHYVWERRIKYF